MNKTSLILLSAIWSAFLSLNAQADGCTNPTNSYDRTYCAGKLFIQSDTELNEEYQSLHKLLDEKVTKLEAEKKKSTKSIKEIKDAKAKLTATQRDWIKYRNGQCESKGSIEVKCNMDVNVARTNFFRDRLRECRAGHCQLTKMGEKSW